MTLMYEKEKLNDLELRLGFLVCKQIEEFMSGIYPRGSVVPFGSLVNSFGRHHCDVDMVYCVPESMVSRCFSHIRLLHLIFQAQLSGSIQAP